MTALDPVSNSPLSHKHCNHFKRQKTLITGAVFRLEARQKVGERVSKGRRAKRRNAAAETQRENDRQRERRTEGN